ncbi:hypothetical protein EDB19DRAFT_1833791 [Suillus lakei]|nr:hypothetical protein EDB19DRAFT_1833791 [Suillus lakei]
MVNQPTANDTVSLAESTSTRSDVSSSPQSIVDNAAKRVKLILPQVKATPSKLPSATPGVIDVDVDESDAAPAAEQDDEADLMASLVDEYDDHLRQPVENTKVLLQWLFTIALASITAYVLHAIATSTAVERVSSQGRHLLHYTRNCLSPSSTRAFLCLGSWLCCDLLAPKDLTKIIKSLKKRKRKDESVG